MRKVTLHINPTENGEYQVVVSGEGFYSDVNAEVGVRIRGEDKWFDDKLFSFNSPYPPRVLEDGTFITSKIVPGEDLNEDWGEDEIYALVKVKGQDYKTNTVKGVEY
jgi:hypothetical protein